MKRRCVGLALTACLFAGSTLTVCAEDYTVGSGFTTWFADGKMSSNFEASEITDAILDLQPGDSVTIGLTLQNQEKKNTDWYMTNQVLQSLEDSQSAASGGAYTYDLTYTDSTGAVTTLYSSGNVGGEKESALGEGLHEATAALGEYIYLDRLEEGASGKVALKVALDGETQGNGYQNTLAKLQMAFAVEPISTGNGGSGGGNGGGGGSSGGSGGGTPGVPDGPASVAYSLGAVQTGDTSPLVLWSAFALIAGLALLIWAVVCFRREEGEQEDA